MIISFTRIKGFHPAPWLFGMLILCLPFLSVEGENPPPSAADSLTAAGEHASSAEKPFDAGEMIMEHILDAHEWHIAKIGNTNISIPLPVILYADGAIHIFSSGRFHHGEVAYAGFKLETEGKFKGKIVKVLDDGITPDESASLPLDFSITKNVLSLFISVALLMFIFITIANSYTKRKDQAPKGIQSLLEPII